MQTETRADGTIAIAEDRDGDRLELLERS